VATNLGLAFCVAAFALVPFATSFALAVVLLVLFGIGLSIENSAFPALASDVAPDDRRGTVLGVVSGLDSLAGFVMPPITTGVLGAFGVPPVAAIMTTLVVAAFVLGLVQTRRAGPRTAAAAASGE
jgi:MFS family permease